jgi:hypothetical protein
VISPVLWNTPCVVTKDSVQLKAIGLDHMTSRSVGHPHVSDLAPSPRCVCIPPPTARGLGAVYLTGTPLRANDRNQLRLDAAVQNSC